MKLLIGADPEVFVTHRGGFVSGHGMIPGTKMAPHPVNYGAVQVDGMALEFNIDPAETEDQFVGNIRAVYDRMAQMIPVGMQLAPVPVATFSEKVFWESPDEARELGCTPDYNAWTGDMNPKPDGDTTMRTASGHIHIGWTKDMDPYDPAHYEDCRNLVKQLDYYLGVPSLLWDTDNRRRKLYGKAGAFRPKSYGVEYRVLSNVWLTKESLIRYVYRATRKAVVDLVSKENVMDEKWNGTAQYIIDENDTEFLGWYTGLSDIKGLKIEEMLAA